jgi:hypothetical protein
MQYGVFQKLLDSPMSQNWIDRFEANWQKIPHGSAVR